MSARLQYHTVAVSNRADTWVRPYHGKLTNGLNMLASTRDQSITIHLAVQADRLVHCRVVAGDVIGWLRVRETLRVG